MKKFFFFVFLLLIFSSFLSADKKNPDIIRRFIQNGDYENALMIINKIKADSSFADSLNFFKAIIYEKTDNPKKAINIYYDIITNSADSCLVKNSSQRLVEDLKQCEASFSIDLITKLLTLLKDKNTRKKFLFYLAQIYEKNLLYNEANDVYQTILTDTISVDTLKILTKIAQNKIYLKEFAGSRAILDSILNNYQNADSLNILYLKAFTYFKETDYDKAIKSFLYLYKTFPKHPKRWDIMHYLALSFSEKKQYLLAWYLLGELYKISNEAQKFELYEEINTIKEKFLNDKTAIDQFKYFVPKWDSEKTILKSP